jgi:choline kinase
MAGSGSRLQRGGEIIAKPLVPLLGRPLISYTFDTLASRGIKTIHAVVGFNSESLRTRINPLIPAGIDFHWIENPEWQKQNGVSVLAAASFVEPPFLLTMGDHIFDASIVDLVLRESAADKLNLAVDRKRDAIFDLDDALKLQLDGDRIVAIGKDLSEYQAIDTGVFLCPATIFSYLEAAKRNGDCSMADGMRLMATENKVRLIDIGDAWWQDVDTPEMLQQAQKHFGARFKLETTAR